MESPLSPADQGMVNVSLSDNESVNQSFTTSRSIGDLMATTNSNITTPDDGDDAEKARLICQVLELQNTLDDLSSRVDGVKEENLKLKSENQVLGQYIENLMAASSVFQSTSPKSKKKSGGKVKKVDK
ncbi:short coiled-coil protein B-like [Antedon mediterranea]|uniref:short coiled-coil protein B-like n=1 Tax=Antedon mediterranea TaxID=105859 RepID=UPI003AF6A48A